MTEQKSKQIWLVQGNCGEYSDHREWVVCAYTDETKAKKHAVEAKEWRQRNVTWDNYWDDGEPKNPFDDSFYGRHMDTDWTAYAVEVRRSVPKMLNKRQRKQIMCESCGANPADLPSKICVGCDAYRDHQR